MTDYTTFTCVSCHIEYPLTSIFFSPKKGASRGFHPKCKSCCASWQREYRKNHPENIKATRVKRTPIDSAVSKARYPERKGHINEVRRERSKRPEVKKKKSAQHKEWYIANYEYVLNRNRLDRGRRRKAEGIHTVDDIRVLEKTQLGKCWWCGKKFKDGKYHIDHRIPLSKGGSNWPNNLCLSCARCNLSKRDKMPWEWCGRLV